METTADHEWTDKQSLIVLSVLIIGAALAAIWPVWFSPPNTSNTFWLYTCLLLLWFPVLVVLVIAYHRRAFESIFLLLAAGVVVTFIVLALQGANFSAWAIQNKDCTSHETSPGQTEYVCTLVSLFAKQIFTLQGPTGSPFVHLISNKVVSFD